MRSQHRAASLDSQLTLAFGLLGLAGGWLTSELLIWNSNFNRVLMIVCTALVSMGLGYFAPRLWAQSPLLLVLAALLAGAINGVLQMSVLIVASGLHHDIGASLAIVLFTVLVGAVFALPFLPALAAMACCSIHRRRARSGSLLGRAQHCDRLRVGVALGPFAAAGDGCPGPGSLRDGASTGRCRFGCTPIAKSPEPNDG